MDETKITGKLPNLDIEIVRREAVGEGAEVVTITMKATPSFDALSGLLMGAGLASTPLALAANPWTIWANMVQTAWQPWLKLMGADPLLGYLGAIAEAGRKEE